MARAAEIIENGEIWRDPATGYVSIQQACPYCGPNDRFGTGWIEHCGVSCAYLMHTAGDPDGGLIFGADYPDGIQYSPTLASQLLSGEYVVADYPRAGDIGVIDWAGAGFGATWAADHVVQIIAPEPATNTVITWETNTTPDGKAHYYRRHISLFVAWGTPKYRAADNGPPTAARAALLAMGAI